MNTRIHRTIVCAPAVTAAGLLSFAVGACNSAHVGGASAPAAANDALRSQVLALEDKVRALEAERDELKAKLSEEQRVRAGALSEEVVAAIPRCAGIDIGSLSGFEPADPAKPPTMVVAYIDPHDGRGRFVQMVGTLKVAATLTPPAGQQGEPRQLGAITLTPARLRDAYRSGVTGTHYTVEIPLSEADAAKAREGELLVTAEFLDAITGRAHQARWVRK